jgi:hypothetical protein
MEQPVLLKPTSLNGLKYCPELYLSQLHYRHLCPHHCAIQYMWYCPACSHRGGLYVLIDGLVWPGVRSLCNPIHVVLPCMQSLWWALCSDRRPGLAWSGVRSLCRIKVKEWP